MYISTGIPYAYMQVLVHVYHQGMSNVDVMRKGPLMRTSCRWRLVGVVVGIRGVYQPMTGRIGGPRSHASGLDKGLTHVRSPSSHLSLIRVVQRV
jgi:hypothetical protein